MNFFESQDKARSQTKFLAGLFLLAVLCIIVAINFIVLIVVNLQTTEPYSIGDWLAQPYWIYFSLSISALILITSLLRSWQLKSTPDAIARMVQATPVSLNTKDAQKRRLINVVEEMSIASGVPIPKLYVMEAETGINAFVAGLEPESILLVVTQGLLDNLNRQELQGVIAHEYSHIFHGDMRINVKLIGILAGLLVIGQLGMILLRASSHRSYSSRSSSGNAFPVLAIGAGLFVIGYIGLFFGRLIKAAISRQREFLADASAIQYTRDNQGICSALFKISQHQQRAYLDSDKAEEMSHLCFGQSVKLSFSAWLATHPPIQERISALNPHFKFDHKAGLNAPDSAPNSHSSQPYSEKSHFGSDFGSGFHSGQQTNSNQSGSRIQNNDQQNNNQQNNNQQNSPRQASAASKQINASLVESINATQALAQIGAITPEHLDSAHQAMETIPATLLEIARVESNTANEKDLLVALLLANRSLTAPNSVDEHINQLANHSQLKALSHQLKALDFKQQHILLELALARLSERTEQDKRQFVSLLSRLVKADQKLTLSEFMIYASCAKRALGQKKSAKEFTRFKQLEKEISAVLNLLYQQSTEDKTLRQQQFEKHLRLLGLTGQPLNRQSFSTADFAIALNRLSQLHPLLKQDFISLCVDVVESDGFIMQKEYEILRLLGEYLGCPFPIAIQ